MKNEQLTQVTALDDKDNDRHFKSRWSVTTRELSINKK